jgi:hypothetical protein
MLRLRVCAAALLVVVVNAAAARAQEVTFTIDAATPRHTIPQSVYGTNDRTIPGATWNRHGGNRHTGLNWENNASNAGSDWQHSSDGWLGQLAGIGNSQTPGALLQAWLNADRAAGLRTIITLPLAGYVAADMNGTVTSAQTAPGTRWKQIVVEKPGPLSLTPDTTDGVVYLDEMVNFLLVNYGTAAQGGVAAYSLDNEPALWSETHPRIHPAKATYAEIVSRHTAVATRTTALDASAQIIGPVLYGWSAHLNLQSAPDAATHNNTYGNFTNYYLAQMQSASTSAARRLLHFYDMHWYPEARGDNRIVFSTSPGTANDIDARLQAPRSLWDAAYVENSWITQHTTGGQGIRLLPRLRASIDAHFPGTALAVTEYNYGATDHISGGVAQADVLGTFGRFSVMACFWPLTSDNSYVAAAFQLYRNYDAAGAAFGEVSLDAFASDNARAAVHASRVSNSKMTVVATNRSRTLSRTARFNVTLPPGRAIIAVKPFRLTSDGGPQVQPAGQLTTFTSSTFDDTLPAMSATLYEVQLAPVTYSAWQQDEFGDNGANPEIAGPTADPDRDGVPNLVEYATGRNPNQPDEQAVITTTMATDGAGERYLLVQFTRRRHLTDIQLLLQRSTTLAVDSWSNTDPATLQPQITTLDAATERWTIQLPLTTTREFLRLRVSR